MNQVILYTKHGKKLSTVTLKDGLSYKEVKEVAKNLIKVSPFATSFKIKKHNE